VRLKMIVCEMHWPEEECATSRYSRGKESDVDKIGQQIFKFV
jgi:hypothetical protein